MSVYIDEHSSHTLKDAFHQHYIKNGALRFYTWKLNQSSNKQEELTLYNIHNVVARQSIETVNFEIAKGWNSVISEYKRSEYPNLQIDYNALDKSGVQLSIDEFLGFDYDWLNGKPKFKGRKD